MLLDVANARLRLEPAPEYGDSFRVFFRDDTWSKVVVGFIEWEKRPTCYVFVYAGPTTGPTVQLNGQEMRWLSDFMDRKTEEKTGLARA